VKRGLIFLPFLLLIILNHTVTAGETGWTEKKLGKVILKAEKAARQKQWPRAIRYGELILEGVQTLNQKSDPRYINQLRNLNKFYDNANRLDDIAARVEEAYGLSQKHMGPAHETTIRSRILYYKLLISRKEYLAAIPLVLENISILGETKDENVKRLHYLKQLYSLYRMTGQLEKEEKTLLQFLDIDKRVFGSADEDNIKIILNLANNYCRQKKIDPFNQLMATHKLKYKC